MHRVRLMECSSEIIHQSLRPRITMRLEQYMHLLIAASARRGQRRANLGRMMAIIIDNRHASFGALHLKPAIDSSELRQPFANLLDGYIQLKRDGNRRRCITDVVCPWNLQPETSQ